MWRNGLWFGILNESHGRTSIVVYEKGLCDLPNDRVSLFHYVQKKFVEFEKVKVRGKLTRLSKTDLDSIPLVKLAYQSARRDHAVLFHARRSGLGMNSPGRANPPPQTSSTCDDDEPIFHRDRERAPDLYLDQYWSDLLNERDGH